MSQDPYQLNTDELHVPPSVEGDEYDGVPEKFKHPKPAHNSRLPIIALFAVAILGVGGFVAYEAVNQVDTMPIRPVPIPAGPIAEMDATAPQPSAEELGIPADEITPPVAENGDANPVEENETGTEPTVHADALAPLPSMPAPPEEQLQPIEAQAEVSTVDPLAPLPATQATKPKLSDKTAQTIAAVNEILGKEITPSNLAVSKADAIVAEAANQPPSAQDASQSREMISRAQQVIHVKRVSSEKSPQAVLAAGDRVMRVHQYDDAVKIYDQALKKNPSNAVALSGKALALQKSGDTKAAMGIYQRLLDLNPRDLDSLTNYLGLLQKQNPDEAMGRLDVLAEKYPDNAAIAGQIGAVFASQKDAPNALRYFMKANALDDENPTYPFNIAVLYDRMGNGVKARSYYGQALGIIRENPEMAGGLSAEKIRDRLRALAD